MNKQNPIPEIQVSYQPIKTDEIILRSQEAYDAFMKRWNHDTISMFEEFMILYLNSQNAVIGHKVVSRGGITSCVVDPRIILGIALKCNCSSIIAGHNHPSGSLKPSRADINITNKLYEACKYHDIKFFDHTIITTDGYFSFAEDGLLST